MEAATNQPVVITTSSLPNGFVNLAYSATLTASGGITPYTWSLASGSLSAGLTLNTNTGVITGTPTTLGTSNFTVQVTDAGNPAQTATQALSILVNAAPLSGLIGNTNDGNLSDNIWVAGAWINAGRFQAASNVTVTTMQAKVVGVAGKYKCAHLYWQQRTAEPAARIHGRGDQSGHRLAGFPVDHRGDPGQWRLLLAGDLVG